MNNRKANHLICGVYCISMGLFPLNSHAEPSQPNMALLEFLAEWETDQGEWIDPLQMQEIAPGEQTLTNTEEHTHD